MPTFDTQLTDLINSYASNGQSKLDMVDAMIKACEVLQKSPSDAEKMAAQTPATDTEAETGEQISPATDEKAE